MASDHPTAGGILVTGSDATGGGAVFRVDLATGEETLVSSGGDLATPIGVAVEAGGAVLVADADAFGGRGGVLRVDPASGAQSTLSAGGLFSNPFDLAVEATGAILIVDPHARGVGGVVRVDPATGEQSLLSSGQEPGEGATPLREVGISLAGDGAIFVVEQTLAGGTQGGGRVTRVDPESGARTTVSSGGEFRSAAGVAVEADGGIVVADANAFGGKGGVIRVDPGTGDQTELSSGGSFVSPLGIALDADGGILVADSDAFAGRGGVIHVDPASGDQTRVASGATFRAHGRLAILPAS